MAWAKNGTPDTLTGTGSALEITDLTAQTFNQFMTIKLLMWKCIKFIYI